jgi:hypothetical protein
VSPPALVIIGEGFRPRLDHVALAGSDRDRAVVGLGLAAAAEKLPHRRAIRITALPTQPGDCAERLIAPFRLCDREARGAADAVAGKAQDQAEPVAAAVSAVTPCKITSAVTS